MAFSTYTELKAAIADNAHRTDLTSQIVDAITLCEARLFDMLLLRNFEVESNLTSTASVNYIALPSGYVSPVALWITDDGIRRKLDPALAQELPYDPNNAQPDYWAIDGDNVRFNCPFDAVYTLPFRYVKTSALSGSNASNEILARRPDIYLAGSLAEVARYTQNADLLSIWEPRFLQGCAEMKSAEARARNMVPLRVDPALASGGGSGFNVFNG